MPLSFPLAGIVKRLVKGSALTYAEEDNNKTVLEAAIQTLDSEAVKTSALTPLADLPGTPTGTDEVIVIRGGVPYKEPLSVVKAYLTSTAPAAFVVGNWTATAGVGQIVVDITALPADGGSSITLLQYRLNGGTPVNLTGTGTGSRTITGLTGGTSYDVEIRAVNENGAGAWSDIKTRTPTAGGGAMTLVRVTKGENFGNPLVATFPAVASGNSLIIVTTNDKSDVRINGSVLADSSAASLSGQFTHFFHIDNITDGRTSVSIQAFVSGTPAGSNFVYEIYEVNALGVVVASTVASATGSGTVPSTSFTTTAANAAGFGAVALSNSTTAANTGGWTVTPTTVTFNPAIYNMDLGAAGPKTGSTTLTDSRNWGLVVQAYARA